MAPSENSEIAQIKARLRAIHSEKMSLTDRLAQLSFEETSLHRRWSELENPIRLVRRTIGKCRICGKRTNEKFGEVTQCASHIRGSSVKDASGKSVKDVLEEFLHGD